MNNGKNTFIPGNRGGKLICKFEHANFILSYEPSVICNSHFTVLFTFLQPAGKHSACRKQGTSLVSKVFFLRRPWTHMAQPISAARTLILNSLPSTAGLGKGAPFSNTILTFLGVCHIAGWGILLVNQDLCQQALADFLAIVDNGKRCGLKLVQHKGYAVQFIGCAVHGVPGKRTPVHIISQ